MTHTATGTFSVQMTAEPPYDVFEGVSLGRISIAKQFVGELEATSNVQMLGARGEVQSSAGYVAIERVVGSLSGRSGSFVLQHFGVMTRGSGELKVTIVPDSGTGELRGIAGKMSIEITEGKHYYTLEYELAAS